MHTAHRRPAEPVILGLLIMSVCAFTLLQSLILPVLTRIQHELHTDQATVTWVLTAYLVSAAVGTPVLGRLGDSYGKKRVLVVVLALLGLGSLGAALSPSIGWMIAARVLQGVGGGVMPLSIGIIRDQFSPERRTAGISVVASTAAVGFGLGIVIGGPIADGLGFRWLFLLPMFVTVVAAIGVSLLVPESPTHHVSTIPVTSVLLLATALVGLLLATTEGGPRGWGSPMVLALIIGGLVVGVMWVVVELSVTHPLVDLRMMSRRGVWTANTISACLGFGLFATVGFIPQMVQAPIATGYGFEVSVSKAGWILLPSAVMTFLVGIWTARLLRRLGARTVIAVGALLTGVAFTVIAVWHDQMWCLFAATTLHGVGAGLVYASLANLLVWTVPSEQTAVATGMNYNLRTIGGALGTAVMAAVVTSAADTNGYPLRIGYVVGFLVLAGVALLAVIAARFIPETRLGDRFDL